MRFFFHIYLFYFVPTYVFSLDQPYKHRIWKIQRSIEQEKNLSSAMASGALVLQDQLIVSPEEKWLASFQIKSEKPMWWTAMEFPIAGPVMAFGGGIFVYANC